jgi:hypothetical protein
MSARRPRTLLDFAIVASVAVVPVLLVVLFVVAWLRPLDDSARALRASDRYVSARQVAALKTFEFAIVRRDRVGAGAPTAQALLDGIPECRDEWAGRRGPLAELRSALAHAAQASSSLADTAQASSSLAHTAQAAPSLAQRIAAQLAELDAALDRFSSGANRRVTDRIAFDARRWFEAVRSTLRAPAESPEYPMRRFAVRCADIAQAVATLTRANFRMLDALAWRGTEVQRVVSRWRPDQFVEISPRQVARANPWGGIAGCIYLGEAGAGDAAYAPAYFVSQARGIAEWLCRTPEMRGASAESGMATVPTALAGEPTPELAADDPRWNVPPSLDVMLASLDTLRRPTGELYRLHADGSSHAAASPGAVPANAIHIGGRPIEVGYSIDVTIDAALQALAQKTTACYTGRQDICAALGMRRKEDDGHPFGHRLLEHAVVRMAAVAVIDVGSGRIEALAGSLSPCTRQEYDGPGRAANCDKRLPYPIRYLPDALLNPAVFHDAMPASVIKPIMAAAFLADPDVGARWLASERAEALRTPWPTRDSLRGQLMRSDSARFLDRMFCADKGFANCQRPWNVQAAAAWFGWNGGCTVPREDCGKRDLLFGRPLDAIADADGAAPVATIVPYGRLLVEPVESHAVTSFRSRRQVALDQAKVRACAAGPDGRRLSRDDWEKCKGGVVVDVVAEGWGQGNARSSALGVAGMLASLAAAANGEPAPPPHLVRALHGVGGEDATALGAGIGAAKPAGASMPIPHDAAELVLNALSFSHRGGTARLACEQVFDARTCRDADWIAGKTGTPTFPNDDMSLDELVRLCAPGMPRTRAIVAACGALRPYKWYVAAYRTDANSQRWTKVIGVLTERNWVADTGRIHGAGDHGPNPAAEIALQIAARHAGRYVAPNESMAALSRAKSTARVGR